MKIAREQFTAEDEDTWILDNVEVSASRSPVRVAVYHPGERPSVAQTAKLEALLSDIEALVLRAAPLILENYSYDHFKKLGVGEDQLVEETDEAVARAIVLESVYFFGIDEDEFELSFSAPWDPHHSFDVEFEAGEAVTCAVNG